MPLVEGPALLPPTTTRLLLFAGKGGTGKTTLACATALRLNRVWPRRKVLLFSTDPAHSLADCLGLAVGPQATRVAAGLWALEMDAQAELESLKQQYRQTLDAFFSRVLGSLDLPFDREVMERIIELSPPGLDEIMALTRAMDFLSAATYDLLVLDSAPTGHFIRLLEMPQLVDDWLKAFFELFLKYREVFGTPQLADRMVQISKDLRRFRALLGDPAQSAVAAASIPTRMALEETTDLFASCRRMGVEVAVLFLNMMTPESGCPFCAQRARQDREVVREYARSLPVHRTLVFRQPEPRGLDRLKKVGDALYLGGAPKGGTLDARASP
jgi:arsenite-transporting ATPase